jgi:hypothetical protein
MQVAMSCTITEENAAHVKKIKFVWVSAADGTASGTTTMPYSGEIIRLVTIPAAAAAAPSVDYDVVVNDQDNTDVLMGAGANRHTANTEQVAASSLGCVANDLLTLAVSNAGDTKGGTVILYVR